MSNKVKWVVESNVFDHYAKEMVAAAESLDIELKLTPEVGYGYTWDDSRSIVNRLFPKDDCVVFHGSIGMTVDLASNSIWKHSTFCNWENLECATYYCHFGPTLVNNDYAMLPFGELRRCREWLFEAFGTRGQVFMRPNSCQKSFTGQLVGDDSFDGDLEIIGFYDLPINALVVITSPKLLVYEWRLVVVDRKVVTGCQYKKDGQLQSQPNCPQAVIDWFEQSVLAVDWTPDIAWTADVCQLIDGSFRLLEIGSITCSDLYECDKRAVIEAMSDLVANLDS